MHLMHGHMQACTTRTTHPHKDMHAHARMQLMHDAHARHARTTRTHARHARTHTLDTLCVCTCLQAKYEFRNFINTRSTKRETQIANVMTALGDQKFEVRYSKKMRDAPLPIIRVRRFDRKCRDYERAYMCYKTPRALHRATIEGSDSGFQVIKKIIGKVKAHRCTGALQSRVCIDDGDLPSSWLQQLKI